MQTTLWGKTPTGAEIDLYTLTNANGLVAKVTSFGGRIVSLEAPDREGRLANVNLGFDNAETYVARGGSFGATVGRYCNRIADGAFTLDGVRYELDKNERSVQTLHACGELSNAPMAGRVEGESVVLTTRLPDGHHGFPGNVDVTLRYTLTDDNALQMDYEVVTDKPTVCSLTNHAYWNLSGDGFDGDIADTVVQIGADQVLAVNELLIPTGVADVTGTKFDLRSPRALAGTQYDHHFVLSGALPQAKAYDPKTGRTLTLESDLPGAQFYTSPVRGSDPLRYNSFCFEAQFCPDSPNHPEWPGTILRPGEVWKHQIRYVFGVE